MVARIGELYRPHVRRGFITHRFTAKDQRRRGSGNAVAGRDIGGYLDFQLLAHIPRRVLCHDVNILCTRTRKVRKRKDILAAGTGSSRPGGGNLRFGCIAVHNSIIIAARFTAGKLHRCGGFALADRAARCQRGRGGISGYSKRNRVKFAGVVGLVVAVALLAEHI